jgi:EAL domain-containing protein (putative c-di-GMP-specific phosphodiesterase class I)
LESVCKQIRLWRERFADFDMKVSLNISGEQFNSRNYIENTVAYLKRQQDITPYLEFEIVEEALIKDLEHTVSVIGEFKKLGIGFCIDDFGTGYSSIEYLKRLPVDIVKIDRRFFLNLFQEHNDEMVKLIVKTSEVFDLQTVAEGVENDQTLEFLREIGCTCYQGFYFSPPVDVEEIEKLIEKQSDFSSR